MKIDCDRVLILSDRLAQLSNVCYEKAEEIHIEKLRIAENSLMDEILKNLENDRKQLEEQAEKLKRYGIALKRIVRSRRGGHRPPALEKLSFNADFRQEKNYGLMKYAQSDS